MRCRYISEKNIFLIVLSFLFIYLYIFCISSFSSFISISFIPYISIPFSIFKFPNNSEPLSSIISIFNPSISFNSVFDLSISNLSISLSYLSIFLNFISSLILFRLPWNLSLPAAKFKFLSDSSDLSTFYFWFF